MPIITIQASSLTRDMKNLIGDRVVAAFHELGVPPSSVVVLFRKEDTDLYLDGGLLIETATPNVLSVDDEPSAHAPRQTIRHLSTPVVKPDQALWRQRLEALLKSHGGLTSLEAQALLGLKDSDWAPPLLRRIFQELEQGNLIVKHGQKRGTRYVWTGSTSGAESNASVILVKKSEPQENGE